MRGSKRLTLNAERPTLNYDHQVDLLVVIMPRLLTRTRKA
jgi:hypothetical protein